MRSVYEELVQLPIATWFKGNRANLGDFADGVGRMGTSYQGFQGTKVDGDRLAVPGIRIRGQRLPGLFPVLRF